MTHTSIAAEYAAATEALALDAEARDCRTCHGRDEHTDDCDYWNDLMADYDERDGRTSA